MVRDMQIIVLDELNDPPQIAEFEDTCVIAGTLLTKTVTASDRNTGQSVEITSAGGPFELSISPARFTAPSPDNPISGLFEWQTTCHHIRRQFYSVIFKAKDSYPVPLVDLKTWIIKVIAPPPENLQAVSQNNSILLTWENPYACDAVEDFIGFSIWRRNGSNDFTVDTCVPGLNGRGYTKIAQNIMSYSFVDSGLQRGNIYCYRVLAEFAKRTESGLFYNKVESLPSNEACAELSRNVPIIHEVNVLVTDVNNGAIEVSWYRPVADSALTPPYRFDVYRSDGFLSNNPVLVRSFTNNILGNLDTTFIDTPLNTVAQPYTYEVAFYASDVEIGKSDAASSVFIQTVPSSNQVDLSWNEEVPWINYSYVIYRRKPGGMAFDSLTTVGVQSYTDAGLINGQEYCYYVKSIGRYSSPDLSDTLENNSQEKCEIPVDIIPPCAPVLEVNNSCQGETEVQHSPCKQPALENFLTWTNPQDAACDQDMVEYRIYFAQTNRDSLQLLTTVSHAQGTSYTHFLDHSIAGCYAVSAVDTYANESPLSNIVCLDNCPCYALPNVFTPNGDGHNDLFTPFVDSLTGKPMHRFIEKVDFKVFNRWGTLVFETHNPDLNWDGTDINTGKPVKEGVYYYVCSVYEIRVDGVIKNSKPLSGFIHLIRGNYN
ncbi:MAG: hypothetical protein KatS3mg031_1865 [Chitinophagales bacterium]|nr:MAG: hypothetical protein KatS3mg031_1865 [Chitinophagales bacterium]